MHIIALPTFSKGVHGRCAYEMLSLGCWLSENKCIFLSVFSGSLFFGQAFNLLSSYCVLYPVLITEDGSLNRTG